MEYKKFHEGKRLGLVKKKRRSGKSKVPKFVQDGPCSTATPTLEQCLDCMDTTATESLCRFVGFRKLKMTKTGLATAGFCDLGDSLEDDLKMWLPEEQTEAWAKEALIIMEHVGDLFCTLIEQEKAAVSINDTNGGTIAWKRIVEGVRDMCDVCETTLFNFHWVCERCGFMACIDCYMERQRKIMKIWQNAGAIKRDCFGWLQCANRAKHKLNNLMLTQFIAGDSLSVLGQKVHELSTRLKIPKHCGCLKNEQATLETDDSEAAESFVQTQTLEGLLSVVKEYNLSTDDSSDSDSDYGPVSIKDIERNIHELAISNKIHEGNHLLLREMLTQESYDPNFSQPTLPESQPPVENLLDKAICLVVVRKFAHTDVGDNENTDVVDKENMDMVDTEDTKSGKADGESEYLVRQFASHGRNPFPMRTMNLGTSKLLYPDVPHRWLCEGRLVQLIDPEHPGNITIFQDQWKRGQPVVISGLSQLLDKSLWTPESFSRDFGKKKTDLINCVSGKIVPWQPMRYFWEGYDSISKRLKSMTGEPMLLKLKDWPASEDFAEILPLRFKDLMRVLPMPEYTHRSGKLNLSRYLPECFVHPDLGPKMYSAYGSVLSVDKGTTNLHLDVSDAVNVMVYVSIPKDGDREQYFEEAFKAIDEAGCDMFSQQRVREGGEIPGALWHIFNEKDAKKIHAFLHKISLERSARSVNLKLPQTNPIHDQGSYLDGQLRKRLYDEYGVLGYSIVQCLGDAIFVPAGTPHQVRNLLDCIKVAEDFVSPENLRHCLTLTDQFRELTNFHMNHEDKLQAKSILYHSVKSSLATLTHRAYKETDQNAAKSPSHSDLSR